MKFPLNLSFKILYNTQTQLTNIWGEKVLKNQN